VAGIAIVPAQADESGRASNPYLLETVVDDEGRELDVIIVPGRPPEIKAAAVSLPEPNLAAGINILSNVPAFDWCYGCSATSAAMMFGYYDNSGYANMYTGPTNGGACPMDNSTWGSEECPLSATHQGKDGLATKGHVDDYWSAYGSSIDPYHGVWAEHGYADCTADFMGTNQYHNWQNTDGSTTFFNYVDGSPLYDYSGCEPGGQRDGCHGIKLFVESRGYTVLANYNQYIYGHGSNPALGFTFEEYKAEIDAGRPVLIQVEGHSMLGYGYDDTEQTVYLHDTWDYGNHSMSWGGSYEGLQHYGVAVIVLEEENEWPDLVVIGKYEEWLNPANRRYDISFTVQNQGNAPAAPSRTYIYRDGGLVSSIDIASLAAGASEPHTVSSGSFTLSGSSDTISVCADAEEDVPESNEENNCTENLWEWNMDLGDAPDGNISPIYPTLLVNNGACHNIVSGFHLGSLIDSEPDGQPNASATGDDLLDGNDDEDGVVFTSALTPGQQATITVTASQIGKLDAWLDFNSDGDWADAGEQIFASQSLSAGANALSFPVLGDAALGQTFARFRYGTTGGLSYDGYAPDGEVEDYQVFVIEEGEGIPVCGIVHQVDCNPLDEALVELLYDGPVITNTFTDADGFYTLYAPSAGDYELRASKAKFRTETQPVTVGASTVTLYFCGEYGLIPNAPDVFYVMSCVGCWQFPGSQPLPCCGLDVFRVMNVVGAWQFPV